MDGFLCITKPYHEARDIMAGTLIVVCVDGG
jgi:hypothetical protein